MIDHLFTGNVLGHESDIADGRLRGYEFRSLNNIVGDYYVSPRFLEAVAVCFCHVSSPYRSRLLLSVKHLWADCSGYYVGVDMVLGDACLCFMHVLCGSADSVLKLACPADAHCQELASGQWVAR